RRHTRFSRDWSSDVCLPIYAGAAGDVEARELAERRAVPGGPAEAVPGGEEGRAVREAPERRRRGGGEAFAEVLEGADGAIAAARTEERRGGKERYTRTEASR